MIPLHKVYMAQGADRELKKTLYSGFIGEGERVKDFEKALVPWIGRKTILAVNSCTSALTLSLRLSGVGQGDEVISTPVTCTATNVPILSFGAKIVWADVDPRTGCIDPASVKAKITKKTKAVLAVHWGGLPCDLDPLMRLCRDNGLKLIEDAAHALGAQYKGQPIGSHGDYVCFSFQAIKHLTTGDGGLLSCKTVKDYEKAKLLRWYGIRRPANLKKDIPDWGYKFHMNDINATIGLANLKDLCWILRRHRDNAHWFSSLIQDRLSSFWFLPWHEPRKPEFIKHMAKNGVQVGEVHQRNDRYTMFKDSLCKLPGADAFCKTQVNIPCGWWVRPKDLVRIMDTVDSFK